MERFWVVTKCELFLWSSSNSLSRASSVSSWIAELSSTLMPGVVDFFLRDFVTFFFDVSWDTYSSYGIDVLVGDTSRDCDLVVRLDVTWEVILTVHATKGYCSKLRRDQHSSLHASSTRQLWLETVKHLPRPHRKHTLQCFFPRNGFHTKAQRRCRTYFYKPSYSLESCGCANPTSLYSKCFCGCPGKSLYCKAKSKNGNTDNEDEWLDL